jgi:hypothetical protein
LFDQEERLGAKSQIDAFRSSKEIRNYRIRTAPDPGKQQRWATLLDHAPVNLSRFQIGINLDIDAVKVLFLAKKMEKVSKT